MGRTLNLSSRVITAPVDDTLHPAHNAKHFSVQIGETSTQFLLQSFGDRIFIVVTQMNKLGTLVSAAGYQPEMEHFSMLFAARSFSC